MLIVLWVQQASLTFKESVWRAVTLVSTSFVLLGVGAALANANLVQDLVNTFSELNNLPPDIHFWGRQIHVLLGDIRLLVYGTLLLGPLISALLSVYVGSIIVCRHRWIIWIVAIFQVAMWALVLVGLFSVSFADIVTTHTTLRWWVDGTKQPALNFGQAQYLSSEIFLSFSFGDIVPYVATAAAYVQPHVHHSATIASHLQSHRHQNKNAARYRYLTTLKLGVITQIIQLEALTSHLYWVGVISSFVGLFWNPARSDRVLWELRWRKINPLTWLWVRRVRSKVKKVFAQTAVTLEEHMDKESLLRIVAEMGYNVGFGAKKHLATYDIVEKVPGALAFLVLAVGIWQLAYPNSSVKAVSVGLILVSIAGLLIASYNTDKDKYAQAGTEITHLYYELRDLYYKVRSSNNTDFGMEHEALKDLEKKFNDTKLTKQIMLSDWYAHYKFFYQMQHDWVNEQLKFSFWRDKLPKSLLIVVVATVILLMWRLGGKL